MGPQLVPLAASAEDLRLSGEAASRDIVFVAQPSQTVGSTSLVLTLQSAVSDEPERSRLAIAINDKPLGTVSLRAGAPYTVRLPVPSGTIQPGYNVVQLEATQSHRVDCSLDATYELWTQIDPRLSGVQYAVAPALEDGLQQRRRHGPRQCRRNRHHGPPQPGRGG